MMKARVVSRIWQATLFLALALLAGAVVRWIEVRNDLNQPTRREAWEELQRTSSRSYIAWDRIPGKDRDMLAPRFDPDAARLWLAVGFDPNGDFCARRGKPPNAFWHAFGRPLGFCAPRNSDQVPFITVVMFGHSAEGLEVARLMIAAGAAVNRISSDGIVPLRTAVLLGNEGMVKLLLEAGADPGLKPKYNQIGDYRSAAETADALPKDPRSDRIREMLGAAGQAKGSGASR